MVCEHGCVRTLEGGVMSGRAPVVSPVGAARSGAAKELAGLSVLLSSPLPFLVQIILLALVKALPSRENVRVKKDVCLMCSRVGAAEYGDWLH